MELGGTELQVLTDIMGSPYKGALYLTNTLHIASGCHKGKENILEVYVYKRCRLGNGTVVEMRKRSRNREDERRRFIRPSFMGTNAKRTASVREF